MSFSGVLPSGRCGTMMQQHVFRVCLTCLKVINKLQRSNRYPQLQGNRKLLADAIVNDPTIREDFLLGRQTCK